MNKRPTFQSRARRQGFTLFETVVATGISVLGFAAIASMMLYGTKSCCALGNRADLSRLSRAALDQMSTDIRQANKVISCASNQLVIQAVDISSGATNNLTYQYDPVAQTLSRVYLGATNKLLTGIISNSLQFTMYQRNTIGGDVNSNYVTTTATNCKILQVSWTCSRSVMALGQTENDMTAKIVIRKE